ncbi:MAG: hypothetical protein HY811_05400 [Planctomycetes bacterium]|nr:hypothetical protein [Planctomycetota bacterium]
MEDNRTDEQLVESFYKGDKSSLEILLNRYSTIILGYLCGISLFVKDKSFLDDVRQQVLMTIWNELNQKKLTELTPGAFNKWVYKITYFACLNADKKHRREKKTTSEIFTKEDTNLVDVLYAQTTPTTSDYEDVAEQLKDASSKLDDEELELMQLVSQKVEYIDIVKKERFKQYSVDALKQKVYNIRKRLKGIKHEDGKDKK